MATASVVRACHLLLVLMAYGSASLAGEDCITTKTQPNVRRHIEKLAQEAVGDSIDRSTFSYCGFNADEYASVASAWRTQDDGSRLHLKVNCSRQRTAPKKPWTCEPEPERQMDVSIAGRSGTLVTWIDVKMSVELATKLVTRAFEAAGNVRATKGCESPPGVVIYAEVVERAFADPGRDPVSVHQREDRLLVDRRFTTIVFKRNTAAQDGFELDCWYTYDEL